MKKYPLIVALVSITFFVTLSQAATPSAISKYIKSLVNRGTLIAKLPPASNSVALRKKASLVSGLEVIGTPPTLISLKNSSLKEMFWSNGVIDDINSGAPSPYACQQYLGRAVDGESAGQTACYMSQDLARSFEIALKGENTFCYMQKMITATDGVTVSGARSVEAALTPNKDDSPKIVKIEITGQQDGGNQNLFFVIAGRAANRAQGKLYEHSLFFCDGGANPKRYEHTQISKDLIYEVYTLDSTGAHGDSESTISAKLAVVNDKLTFNQSIEKEISVSRVGDPICNFAELDVSLKNGKIKQKSNSFCAGNHRSAYSVLKYGGQSVSTLRFKEGAVKAPLFTAITEFRNDRYVSAPNNAEFNADLTEVDLTTDPFYASGPTVDTSILGTFNCNTTELAATILMDFSNQYLSDYTASCKNKILDRMDFCRNDSDLNNAENNFHSHCP